MKKTFAITATAAAAVALSFAFSSAFAASQLTGSGSITFTGNVTNNTCNIETVNGQTQSGIDKDGGQFYVALPSVIGSQLTSSDIAMPTQVTVHLVDCNTGVSDRPQITFKADAGADTIGAQKILANQNLPDGPSSVGFALLPVGTTAMTNAYDPTNAVIDSSNYVASAVSADVTFNVGYVLVSGATFNAGPVDDIVRGHLPITITYNR